MAIVAMIAMTKNPTKKTLSKVTMSIMTPMTIGFWGLTGRVFPFQLCHLLVFRVFFGLNVVAASSLIGFVRPLYWSLQEWTQPFHGGYVVGGPLNTTVLFTMLLVASAATADPNRGYLS